MKTLSQKDFAQLVTEAGISPVWGAVAYCEGMSERQAQQTLTALAQTSTLADQYNRSVASQKRWDALSKKLSPDEINAANAKRAERAERAAKKHGGNTPK